MPIDCPCGLKPCRFQKDKECPAMLKDFKQMTPDEKNNCLLISKIPDPDQINLLDEIES